MSANDDVIMNAAQPEVAESPEGSGSGEEQNLSEDERYAQVVQQQMDAEATYSRPSKKDKDVSLFATK